MWPSCWLQHMSLDNETVLDPFGIKVRPVNGLVAADYFAPGYFVWAVLIAHFARVGYEEKNMYMAAYDWRLSFQNTEVRDRTLSRLKRNIEMMVEINGGEKAKMSLMIALNAKKKMKIITGEFAEPRMGSELRALWEMNNDMLISWILNTVSKQIGNNLNFINSASKLWLKLQEHYAQIDGHKIYQLRNDIVQLKQENSSVEMYYQKLKGLWDEFDALEAPYLCLCICSCANGRINGEKDQRKRLIKFLIRLDECYLNIMGQILLMQPLRTAAKAYTMIRHEEKQREGIAPKSTSSTYSNRYNP
ncbi:cysteine-rich receptor-like protein kinase 8 [Tanacetum coccineum]